MYRDVAKRILAVGLAFCMVGSTPDFTLLAKGAADQAVNTEADPERVVPKAGGNARVEDGVLHTVFGKKSWNVIRLAR